MRGFVYLFQFLECGVGVDFRRSDTFMPQQFLHAFQTRAVIEHRSGKGMAQHMRRPFLRRAHA